MGYVIYPDMLFLLNFIVNYILLFFFGKMARKKKSIVRFIAGSGIGALGAVLYALQVPVFYLPCGLLMILISFPKMTIKETVASFVYFLGFNLLVGGALLFLKEHGVMEVKGWQVILAVFLAGLGMSRLVERFYETARVKKNLYFIEVQSDGMSVSGMALLDTGNQLRDPFFGRPVMLGERDQLAGIMEKQEMLQWIPFHSIGKDHGMLPAIKVEKLVIHGEKHNWVKENVLIAVKDGNLSVTRQYQFILHEAFMTE